MGSSLNRYVQRTHGQIIAIALLYARMLQITVNPPYGSGTVKATTNAITTNRTEIAFICKVIELLKPSGKACIITPDGVLENPSYKKLRKEILEKCEIYAIVSLPKFAFAPYTKEKTYALFIKRRANKVTKIQDAPIWMYIIDNDGLANSDKRFPTKLRNNRNGWMHDEISGWVSTDGIEMPGILEKRWLKYDDSGEGQEAVWINEKGIEQKARKGGNIDIKTVLKDNYITLLPEYYLRPYSPHYIDEKEFEKEVLAIEEEIRRLFQ